MQSARAIWEIVRAISFYLCNVKAASVLVRFVAQGVGVHVGVRK